MNTPGRKATHNDPKKLRRNETERLRYQARKSKPPTPISTELFKVWR